MVQVLRLPIRVKHQMWARFQCEHPILTRRQQCLVVTYLSVINDVTRRSFKQRNLMWACAHIRAIDSKSSANPCLASDWSAAKRENKDAILWLCIIITVHCLVVWMMVMRWFMIKCRVAQRLDARISVRQGFECSAFRGNRPDVQFGPRKYSVTDGNPQFTHVCVRYAVVDSIIS